MIMDSRIAAELLYESEATLRMVDTALDELRIGDEDRRKPSPRLEALSSYEKETDEFEVPPEFCVRAFWQVQDVAECVRDSRELLQSAQPRSECMDDIGDQGRLDRVLSLIDRLDSMDESGSRKDSDLISQLRDEIVGVLQRAELYGGTGKQIGTAIALLAEAEGRLTRLGHVFDGRD